jgi:hypothetical protein
MGLMLGTLLVILGMQAEPISGTVGVIMGALLMFATVVAWTKKSN